MPLPVIEQYEFGFGAGGASTIGISFPTPPKLGSQIFLFVATSNLVTAVEPTGAISQPGVSWSPGYILVNTSSHGRIETYRGYVGAGADPDILINIAHSQPTVAVAVEVSKLDFTGGGYPYSDFDWGFNLGFGTSTSASVINTEGAGQDYLVIGYVHNDDFSVGQSGPTALIQLGDIDGDGVRLGIYAWTVSGDALQSLNTTLSSSVAWSSALMIFDAGVTVEKTAQLSVPVVIVHEVSASMDMVIKDSRWAQMNMHIQGESELSANLNTMIVTDGSPAVSLLEMLISGSDQRTLDMDAYLIGTAYVSANLQVFKSLEFTRFAVLSVHVGAGDFDGIWGGIPGVTSGISLKAAMDMSILVTRPISNVATTPEDNRYTVCRPLWCGVPKEKEISSLLQVAITNTTAVGIPMNVAIADIGATTGLLYTEAKAGLQIHIRGDGTEVPIGYENPTP